MSSRWNCCAGIRRMLVFVVASVVLIGAGNQECNPKAFLEGAIEERFPELPLEQYITDEEIADLVALDEASNDEKLLGQWEFLVLGKDKSFGPPLHVYGYNTKPIYAIVTLLRCTQRRPEFTDRVLQIVSTLNDNATYEDVVSGIPSTLTKGFFNMDLGVVKEETLRHLLKSIPDEKEYVLAHYKWMTIYRFPVDAGEVYSMYSTINRDNFVEMLKGSPFADIKLVEPENEEYGLHRYYQVRDLIEERLELIENTN